MSDVILTPKFRAGYLRVLDPQFNEKKNRYEWTVEMIFEEDAKTLKPLVDAYKETFAAKHGSAKIPTKSFNFEVPALRKGVPDAFTTGVVREGREGKVIATATSVAPADKDGNIVLKFPPPSVHLLRNGSACTVTPDMHDQIYPGAYYVANVRPYAWVSENGTKGVSFGLDSICKVADGVPLIAQVDRKGAFESYASAEGIKDSGVFNSDEPFSTLSDNDL